MLLIQKLMTEREMILFCESLEPEPPMVPSTQHESIVDSELQPQNPLNEYSPDSVPVTVEEMKSSDKKQSPASATIANFGYGQA